MASYLLLEDGGRITLEDGSGSLLLEDSSDTPVVSLPSLVLGSGPQRAGTVGSDYYLPPDNYYFPPE